MEIENIFIILLILFNFLLIVFFDKIKIFHINLDYPDGKRKLHKRPVPLAGGIIIFSNLIIYLLFILNYQILFLNEIIFENNENFILFFITSFLIFGLGFVDDKLNLSASRKFLLILIIIFLTLFFDNSLCIKIIKFSFLEKELYLSKYFSLIFTCFCFLVFLNACNMFDGINLQSGAYSIIIFLGILNFNSESLLIKIILISILTFTFLNLKNKCFLGDSGSLLVSFIIGYFFVKLYNNEIISHTDEVVIYMLLPGIDLIRLFFKRISLKRNPLSSDRFHLHHLLLKKYSYKKNNYNINSTYYFSYSNELFGIKYIIYNSIFYFNLLYFINFHYQKKININFLLALFLSRNSRNI